MHPDDMARYATFVGETMGKPWGDYAQKLHRRLEALDRIRVNQAKFRRSDSYRDTTFEERLDKMHSDCEDPVWLILRDAHSANVGDVIDLQVAMVERTMTEETYNLILEGRHPALAEPEPLSLLRRLLTYSGVERA